MMAVPADFNMEDGDSNYDESMIAAEMEVNENITENIHNEQVKNTIKITKVPPGLISSRNDAKEQTFDEDDEAGVPAPITIAKQSKDLSKKVIC